MSFKNYWMNKTKEEIINAYMECLDDCECLYDRQQDALDYVNKISSLSGYRDYINKLNTIKSILEGD